MKSVVKVFSLVAIFVLGNSFTTVHHSETFHDKWHKLGSKKISYKLDRDVIRVGAKEGTFKKLKIEIKRGAVNMHKMKVEYMNGTVDNIPLRHNFKRGSDSRIIDLEGGKRFIKDITFWYDTKNASRKRAKISVYGK